MENEKKNEQKKIKNGVFLSFGVDSSWGGGYRVIFKKLNIFVGQWESSRGVILRKFILVRFFPKKKNSKN
jgi:hypothetical protein